MNPTEQTMTLVHIIYIYKDNSMHSQHGMACVDRVCIYVCMGSRYAPAGPRMLFGSWRSGSITNTPLTQKCMELINNVLYRCNAALLWWMNE